MTLTLIGKPECHLCEVAKATVERVAGALDQRPIAIEQRSILDDTALYEQYWEQIPVLLVNGVEHAHWRIDPDRLRAAILEV
ncbi:MAG: glutaredoxin family protein [Terrimesophilobacter sp.]